MSIYGKLIYGGINSEDYGIYIVDVNDSDMPVRDYTSYAVPGSSRELHYDNGRYKNIDRTYKCIVYSFGEASAEDIVTAYMAQLCRLRGYQRIEDTIHGDYYKLGEFKGGTKPVLSKSKTGASFDLSFDCDSRKYLRSGEVEQTLGTGTKSIWNPGTEEAYPLFTVTGNGYIEIASRRITVANNTDTLIFDCDIGDAYSETAHTNLNSLITINGAGEIPYLAPGSNSVKVNSFTTCTMIPRWCSL